MTKEKIIDIIKAMIEWGLIDPKSIFDADYVAERISMYIESANMAREMLNMPKL